MKRRACNNLIEQNNGQKFCGKDSGFKNGIVINPLENPDCDNCKHWKPILSDYMIKKYGHNP